MPQSVWDAAVIALKTLTYAATLGAAGGIFFLNYLGSLIVDAERSGIRRIVLGLSAISLFAGAAQIPVIAGSMAGGLSGMPDGSLVRMVWQAGAGRAHAIRTIGLLVGLLGLISHRFAWPALLGAMMAATSFAWIGHARSLHPDALPILLLSVHLLGVSFWLGALTPLLVVAHHSDGSRIAAAAARFGAVAIFVVAGLAAAGLTLLWMMLGDIAELWSSMYGRYVMAKLAFVAGLLGLAAFNNLRLTPRLLANDARALRQIRRSLRLELLLGILILAVTAAFTTVAGPPVLN